MGCARAAGMFPGIDQTGNKSSTWNTTAAHIKNTVKIRGISAGAPTYKDWPWKRSQTGEEKTKRESCLQTDPKNILAKLSSILSIPECSCCEGKEGRQTAILISIWLKPVSRRQRRQKMDAYMVNLWRLEKADEVIQNQDNDTKTFVWMYKMSYFRLWINLPNWSIF